MKRRDDSIRVWFERKVSELGEALKRLPSRSLPPERPSLQALQGGRSESHANSKDGHQEPQERN